MSRIKCVRYIGKHLKLNNTVVPYMVKKDARGVSQVFSQGQGHASPSMLSKINEPEFLNRLVTGLWGRIILC